MYNQFLTSQFTFAVIVSNLAEGTYDIYVYGHGNADNQFGVYDLLAGFKDYGTEATTNGAGWLSPCWQEGVQYVEFTNVNIFAGQSATITVQGGSMVSGLQMALVGPPAPAP